MPCMTFGSADIAIGVLAIAVLILAAIIFYQEKRIGNILKGKNAKNLEDSFESIDKEYKAMKTFTITMKEYLKTVEDRLQKSIQGINTVRFNAWKGNGEGGNQSFASAFISEDGNGLVLSSLQSRDRVSLFAKSIEAGKSSYELSEEEKTALNKALEKVRGKKEN